MKKTFLSRATFCHPVVLIVLFIILITILFYLLNIVFIEEDNENKKGEKVTTESFTPKIRESLRPHFRNVSRWSQHHYTQTQKRIMNYLRRFQWI